MQWIKREIVLEHSTVAKLKQTIMTILVHANGRLLHDTELHNIKFKYHRYNCSAESNCRQCNHRIVEKNSKAVYMHTGGYSLLPKSHGDKNQADNGIMVNHVKL